MASRRGSALRWYVVLADFDTDPCWECSQATGQAWAVVSAHNEEEAIHVAARQLVPAEYEPTRRVRVLLIDDEPSPNHRRPNVTDFDSFRSPRPLVWAQDVLAAHSA